MPPTEHWDGTYNIYLHPTLTHYRSAGIVWYDEESRMWVGKASDGQTVSFDCTAEETEKYLVNFPNPSDW